MATKIQIRRDTAANWTSADPTLSVGEQGFETDTNKMKIGDGVTAWSTLPYMAGGASGLELQAPESANEYYIYVGQEVNKLAQIQDTRGNVSNLTYDQSFATLQEAFDFVQSNTLKDVGYSTYRTADMAAAWVIAIEDGVEITNAGTYWSLAHVSAQILLLNQFALDPAGGTATGTTIGASAALADYLTIYNCGLIQIGGDLTFECFVQIGNSNIKWFYNSYTNNVAWNGAVKIQDGSTFYTDGNMNLKSNLDVQDGSYALINDVTVTGAAVRVRSGATVRASNITVTDQNITVENLARFQCGNISIASTNGFLRSLTVQNESMLSCGTITFGLDARMTVAGGGCKIIHQGMLGTSASTAFQMEPGGTSLSLADFTTQAGFSNVFMQDGISFHNEAATGASLSIPNLPTVDPADGGKSFYLNAGVLTLSS